MKAWSNLSFRISFQENVRITEIGNCYKAFLLTSVISVMPGSVGYTRKRGVWFRGGGVRKNNPVREVKQELMKT